MPAYFCMNPSCRAIQLPSGDRCPDCHQRQIRAVETEVEAEARLGGIAGAPKKPSKQTPATSESLPSLAELQAVVDGNTENKITEIVRREIKRFSKPNPAGGLEPVHASFRFGGPVFVEARESSSDAKGPREFTVEAYTGGKLVVAGYDLPIIVALNGMTFAKSIVANLHHDKTRMVGHVTDKTIANGTLTMAGKVSVPGPDSEKFLQAHDNGFPWQASIEALPSKIQEVSEGQTVQVNGQTHDGPVYVATKSRLHGVAFLPRGADENTSVSVAATAELAFAD